MKKRVLLFHSPGEMKNIAIIAAGLWGIADNLYQNGFEVEIVHLGLEEYLNMHKFKVDRYIDEDVILVAFSVQWFHQLNHSLKISKEIRDYRNDINIIFGGYTASFFYREILENYRWIDGVLRGDGEVPMYILAQTILENDKMELVPNYCWRKEENIIENEFSYVAEANDIKNLSFGKYHKYLCNYNYVIEEYKRISEFPNIFADMKPYTSKTFYMTVGRGCPKQCSYCGGGRSAQKLLNNRDKCLIFPEELIRKTLKEAVINGYKNIYICFDPFANNEYIINLLKIIQKEKLDIALTIGVWGDISEQAIDELVKTSKHIIVEISPETANENLRKINRGNYFSNKMLYENINCMVDKGIHVQVFWGYFIPGDTIETVCETRCLSWDLIRKYPTMLESQYLRYSTDPASPIYMEPEKHNLKLKVKNLQEHLKYAEDYGTNVMVHEVNTINYENQKKWDIIVMYDSILQMIFKEGCTLLTYEYEKISDFLMIINRFYEYESQLGNMGNNLTLMYDNIVNCLNRFYTFLKNDQGENKLITEIANFYYNKYYVINESVNENTKNNFLSYDKSWIKYNNPTFIGKFNYNILELLRIINLKQNVSELVKGNYNILFTATKTQSNIMKLTEEEFTFLSLIGTEPKEISNVIEESSQILLSKRINYTEEDYFNLIKKFTSMKLISIGGVYYNFNK